MMIKIFKAVESKYNACRSTTFQSQNVRKEKYNLKLEAYHY